MSTRRAALLTVVGLLACTPPSPVAPRGDARCSDGFDARAVLERHATNYGGPKEIAQLFPLTIWRLDRDAYSDFDVVQSTMHRSGFVSGQTLHESGIDATGAWSFVSGVVVRLRPDEAVDQHFNAWMARRAYVESFDPSRDAATCTVAQGLDVARLTYRDPRLGNPTLSFSIEQGELLGAEYIAVDGIPIAFTYERWQAHPIGPNPLTDSEVEQRIRRGEPAVSFPRSTRAHAAGTLLRSAGYAYARSPAQYCISTMGDWPSGEAYDVSGDEARNSTICFQEPASALQVAWSQGPRTRVELPMELVHGEILVNIEAAKRPLWAMLDSGATFSLVEATGPLSAVATSLRATTTFAPDPLTLRIGSLEAPLRFGAGADTLDLSKLPIWTTKLPSIERFGAQRPEIILGITPFLVAAVRIDFARKTVTFAPDASTLHAADVPSVPLRLLGWRLVAEAEVEGVRSEFLLDTGSSGGLQLYEPWAKAHGFPGGRDALPPTTVQTAAGPGTLQRFRSSRVALGPIAVKDAPIPLSRPPGPVDVAGFFGNQLLARCAAVVVDATGRRLWFEPPCDRPAVE
jgi:Aspartyl protease